jgi:hypothetical protein
MTPEESVERARMLQKNSEEIADQRMHRIVRLEAALTNLLSAVRHWSGPAPKKVVAAGLVAEAALNEVGPGP